MLLYSQRELQPKSVNKQRRLAQYYTCSYMARTNTLILLYLATFQKSDMSYFCHREQWECGLQ